MPSRDRDINRKYKSGFEKLQQKSQEENSAQSGTRPIAAYFSQRPASASTAMESDTKDAHESSSQPPGHDNGDDKAALKIEGDNEIAVPVNIKKQPVQSPGQLHNAGDIDTATLDMPSECYSTDF